MKALLEDRSAEKGAWAALAELETCGLGDQKQGRKANGSLRCKTFHWAALAELNTCGDLKD